MYGDRNKIPEKIDKNIRRSDGLVVGSYLKEIIESEYEKDIIIKNQIYEEEQEENMKRIFLKKGLIEFTIDGISVVALNERNAIRKVKKEKNNN